MPALFEVSMKKILSSLLGIALLFCSFPVGPVQAQEAIPPEPDSGAVVCPPGIYLIEPDGCLPLGPSAYLTGLARLGMTLPPRPLPASSPDPSLTQLPYRYFHLNNQKTVPIYSAPGQTGAGGQSFPPGFVYVSYVDRWDLNGVYYLLQNGGWIPGDGARVGEISAFQGLVFQGTPRNSFGWRTVPSRIGRS